MKKNYEDLSRGEREALARAAAAELARRKGSSFYASLSFEDWLIAAYVLERGNPYSFVNHEPLMAIAQDKHPYQVWVKSAQVGATAVLIGFALFSAAAGAKVIYYLPDDTLLPDHTNLRMKPVIDNVPWLAAMVANRDAVETVGIGKGVVYNRGLRSKMSKFSTPADILVFDEVNRADERDVFTALSRIEHSANPGIIYVSTPTLPGYGISKRYDEISDARSLMTTCPACGEKTTRDWLGGVVRRVDEYGYELVDREWAEGCGRDVRVHCLKCGAFLDSDLSAEWVAAYPGREYHGYKVGPLDIGRHPVARYWLEFKDIIGNEGLLSIFLNERLGLAYAAAGAKLDVLNLDAAKQNYLPLASCDEPCVLGADIGQATGHRYGVVHLASSRVIAVGEADWPTLDGLYGKFKIVGAVLDGRPETTKAIEFQRVHPNVYLAEYVIDAGGVYLDVKDREDVASKVTWARLDRTLACDRLVAAIRDRDLALPNNAASLGVPVLGKPYNSFYAELMAPARGYENTKTGPRAVWRESGADHYFHALVYALAAVNLVAQRGPAAAFAMSKETW